MKTKQRPKAMKKHQTKRRVKTTNLRRAKRQSESSKSSPMAASASLAKLRVCEEVEIGDIGGFGSPEELESHENRCAQLASQRCSTCGRNLCGTHYELLHKDHDSLGQQETESLAKT